MSINRTEIEIRYQETDQMGVVYHANYLVWFEIGRTKLLEQLGFTYAEMEKQDILSPVIDAHVAFIQPAKYGHRIYVETKIKEYRGARITYLYEIKDVNDHILAHGHTEHTFVNKHTFRPVQLRKVNHYWHNILSNTNEG